LYPVIRILPFIPALGLLLALGILSCARSGDAGEGGIEVPAENDASDPELVVKRRGDGTISSVNQVNELGQVDGTRVTYFPDGKTVYSKLSFRNGIKHGLAVTYYNNGQVFEMATFENGEKHGPQRKFYKTGELLAEYDYEHGHALPGLKEYTRRDPDQGIP
jgi:antitoxin component YwqK of YwqJK toxin-antitoxin module